MKKKYKFTITISKEVEVTVAAENLQEAYSLLDKPQIDLYDKYCLNNKFFCDADIEVNESKNLIVNGKKDKLKLQDISLYNRDKY